jgi:hypothetical protein
MQDLEHESATDPLGSTTRSRSLTTYAGGAPAGYSAATLGSASRLRASSPSSYGMSFSLPLK